MSTERIVTVIIGIVLTGAFGLLFAGIRAVIERAVHQMDDMVRSIKDSVDGIRKEFDDFRIEAARNYATQVQLDKTERENHGSHSKIHSRIDELAGVVKEVETIQKHCRHCRGEQ